MRPPIASIALTCVVALFAVSRADARERAISFAAPAPPPIDACDVDQAPAAANRTLHFSPAMTADLITADAAHADDNGQGQRPVAIENSPAYELRAKIHKWASVATLPLVGTELLVGQSLYNSGGGAAKSAHIAIGTGIVSLFAVNSVTGVWNLWEGRKNPAGRTRRLIHGLLMLGADAGFVATSMTGPEREKSATASEGARSTHRAIAITSIGLATTGYFVMLIGGR
ncbi:MAG: hypothetical protein HYR75_00035 [Gemmatimonadetes bacterium]|nr:hypothetical protein [Gemmatimonadota bacterium]